MRNTGAILFVRTFYRSSGSVYRSSLVPVTDSFFFLTIKKLVLKRLYYIRVRSVCQGQSTTGCRVEGGKSADVQTAFCVANLTPPATPD